MNMVIIQPEHITKEPLECHLTYVAPIDVEVEVYRGDDGRLYLKKYVPRTLGFHVPLPLIMEACEREEDRKKLLKEFL